MFGGISTLCSDFGVSLNVLHYVSQAGPEHERRGCAKFLELVHWPFCRCDAPSYVEASIQLVRDTMVAVEITGLGEGTHDVELHPSAEDLDLDPDTFSDIVIQVHLDLRPEQALVSFAATATAGLECDRTLEPFDLRVSDRHSVLFSPSRTVEEDGADSEEDVYPFPASGDLLDITTPVRDTLLLALPVRRVKPGAEAVEIPLQFGAVVDEEGTPIDPRWEALRRLRDDE